MKSLRLIQLLLTVLLMGRAEARPVYLYENPEAGAAALLEYHSLVGGTVNQETGTLVFKAVFDRSHNASMASLHFSAQRQQELASRPPSQLELDYGTSDVEKILQTERLGRLCNWCKYRVHWWPTGLAIDSGFWAPCGSEKGLLKSSLAPDDAYISAVYFLKPKPFVCFVRWSALERRVDLYPPDKCSPREFCPVPLFNGIYEPILRKVKTYLKSNEAQQSASVGKYEVVDRSDGWREFTLARKDGTETITQVVFRGDICRPTRILTQWSKWGDRWYASYENDSEKLPTRVRLVIYDDHAGLTLLDEEKADKTEYTRLTQADWAGRSVVGLLGESGYDARKFLETLKQRGFEVRFSRRDLHGTALSEEQISYLKEIADEVGLSLTD